MRDYEDVKGDTVKHYKIRNMDNNRGYYIAARRVMSSLPELINHYSGKNYMKLAVWIMDIIILLTQLLFNITQNPEALLRFEISRFITQVHINSNVHINQTSSSQTQWDRGNILMYLKIWNTFVYHTG